MKSEIKKYRLFYEGGEFISRTAGFRFCSRVLSQLGVERRACVLEVSKRPRKGFSEVLLTILYYECKFWGWEVEGIDESAAFFNGTEVDDALSILAKKAKKS